MLRIPKGVNKTTSARSLQTEYKQLIQDMKNEPESVIGVEQGNEYQFVILPVESFEKLRQEAELAEEYRILNIINQAMQDYKEGKTTKLSEEWLKELVEDDGS